MSLNLAITAIICLAIGFVLGAWWFSWVTGEDIADERMREDD